MSHMGGTSLQYADAAKTKEAKWGYQHSSN